METQAAAPRRRPRGGERTMYPAPFEYHRAASVDDALALLAAYGDDGKLIAGGHSLLPVMKLRFSQPAHLIDIRRVPELAGIREQNGTLRIGATTTHAAVAASDVIGRRVQCSRRRRRALGTHRSGT